MPMHHIEINSVQTRNGVILVINIQPCQLLHFIYQLKADRGIFMDN